LIAQFSVAVIESLAALALAWMLIGNDDRQMVMRRISSSAKAQ
jgi:hypothetical protein